MPLDPVTRGYDEPTPFHSLPGWQTRWRLPQPLSSLVGRESDLVAITALIRDDECRLVTLTGPGGVGKTRLALAAAAEVADDFEDGAAFIDLTHIHEPSLVPPAIAQALGIHRGDTRPVLTLLKSALADRHLLLVLDNFEQVIDAAPLVSDLLGACPHLTALVTSRAHLMLAGERVMPVSPLALANDDTEPWDAEAVHLFVERSQAVKPEFALTEANAESIADICARLDGLPLAIELAAAHSLLYSPEELLARLDPRLPLLTGGTRDLPDRQRTMRDTVAWSHDLLDPTAQAVMQRLSVFVGGCTLAAAEAVCAGAADTIDIPSTILSLVRHSLVRVSESGSAGEPSRLTMLATVREFAAEALAANGEAQETARRHAAYYLAMAKQVELAFWGDAPVDERDMTTAESGNLRAALSWAISNGDTDLALHLASAVFDPNLLQYAHHLVRTDPQDHRLWARRALALPGGSAGPRVAALTKAAWLAQTESDLVEGHALAEEALRIAQGSGNELGEATAVFVLGRAAFREGDLVLARRWLTRALGGFQALNVGGRAAWTKCILASIDTRAAADAEGRPPDLSRAAELCDAALFTFRAVGHGPGIMRAMHGRAAVAYYQGEYSRALALYRDVLTQAWEQRLTVRHHLENIAHIAGRMDRPELAARLYGAANEERRRYGSEVLPVRDAELARGMAPAREALGESAFAARMADGGAMSREKAVAEALHFVDLGLASEGIDLTRREREILPLLAQGRTAREIGAVLYLSHRTVEHHIARLAAKLEVHTRAEILDAAREAGLLDPLGQDRSSDH